MLRVRQAFKTDFPQHKNAQITENDTDDTLQVIGAGFPRTGTSSLKAALEMLGYDPCHHMVVCFIPHFSSRHPLYINRNVSTNHTRASSSPTSSTPKQASLLLPRILTTQSPASELLYVDTALLSMPRLVSFTRSCWLFFRVSKSSSPSGTATSNGGNPSTIL